MSKGQSCCLEGALTSVILELLAIKIKLILDCNVLKTEQYDINNLKINKSTTIEYPSLVLIGNLKNIDEMMSLENHPLILNLMII